MENIDSFAQEYLERARRRREILTKKLADTSPRRKRSVPLAENQQENVVIIPAKDDDSPNKRQCLREEELAAKADTPAVPGIKSRMSRLVSERTHWDTEAMESAGPSQSVPRSPSPTPVTRDPTLRDKSPAPKSRKNRLAALAANINNWEDDLSHPTIKVDEPVKKTWQPPKQVEIPLAREHSPPASHACGPSKTTWTYEETPLSTDRQYRTPSPVKVISSPRKEYREEDGKVVSSLTVKLGSSGSSSSSNQPKAASPVKKPAPRYPSPVKNTSPVKAVNPVKHTSPAKPRATSAVDALKTDARKSRRESFEPSAQPVSARLAGWQQRVDLVETESMDPCNNAASRLKVNIPTTPKVTASSVIRPIEEPTERSVHSRMANWEHKTQQDEPEKAAVKPKAFVSSSIKSTPKPPSPQKAPAASVKSPVKSPAKMAPATKGIQEKLQKLQEGWKENEIAEKIKQQRQADLQVLENRWKNGVLKEEDYSVQSVPQKAPVVSSLSEEVPPPPPLPTAGASQKDTSPWKTSPKKAASPIKHVQAPKTPKTPKEDARNKIRQVHSELIAQVMGEQNDGGSKPANQNEHFESKLKTLGFEVDSKDQGVVTLDLKEQREKEKRMREAEKSKAQAAKSKVKVTEEVVTTVQFDDGQKVTKKETRMPGTPMSTTVTSTATPSGGSFSLYGLIKKQTNGQGPVHATEVAGSAQPTPVRKNKFHDSFSSDETSFEEDGPVDEVNIKQTVTVHHRTPSTASDYSESQTEGATTQSDDYSDSEEDYTEADETEYSLDFTENTQSDYSDEEEAPSKTESESVSARPIPAPRGPAQRQERPPSPQFVARKLPPEAHPGHPDHRPPNQGTATTSKVPPPKHPRLHEQQQQPQKHVAFTSPGGSTYRSNSSGSEKSIRREKPYSIDNYRSSANIKRNAPEPRMKIIRRSEHYDPDDEVPEKLPFVPEAPAKQRIQQQAATSSRLGSILQELQELVSQEQVVIMQASNALNQCCGSNSAFAGSQESVECHRVLLLACKKREAYLAEMQRLKSHQLPARTGPKGSLTISDIRLPLKNEFVSRIGSQQDNTIHYFLVLFRHGAHVIFTQMVSTQDAMIRGSLDIPNLIKLNEIREDFVVDMEIYTMSITREIPVDKTPKKKKGMTPKKMASASKKHHPAFQSPGGPNAVRMTNFTFIASMPLTLQMVDKTHFSLERVPFSSPLQGTIHMRLRCLMEISVEEKGFLTMFEDVSGLGAWHRRWCVLKHNSLSFWKYPDDSKYKDPIGTIDLKACISDEIGLVPRDVCARPNTLELVTVRRQNRGELDTLVSRCYNTMTTTKHWISADTKDDRSVWAIKLNEALRNLRAWNPDALRPIKRQQKQ